MFSNRINFLKYTVYGIERLLAEFHGGKTGLLFQ